MRRATFTLTFILFYFRRSDGSRLPSATSVKIRTATRRLSETLSTTKASADMDVMVLRGDNGPRGVLLRRREEQWPELGSETSEGRSADRPRPWSVRVAVTQRRHQRAPARPAAFPRRPSRRRRLRPEKNDRKASISRRRIDRPASGHLSLRPPDNAFLPYLHREAHKKEPIFFCVYLF